MKILLSLIILFVPISILAKQTCIAPSGCKIEMDTGFCPKCILLRLHHFDTNFGFDLYKETTLNISVFPNRQEMDDDVGERKCVRVFDSFDKKIQIQFFIRENSKCRNRKKVTRSF